MACDAESAVRGAGFESPDISLGSARRQVLVSLLTSSLSRTLHGHNVS